MIGLPNTSRLLLYRHPTDMRKSFDGLAGIVRSELQREPTDGSVFLFVNRRRDRIKLLYWDRDGLVLWYKRLQSGTIQGVDRGDSDVIEIDAIELSMLLGGVTIDSVRRRKRFRRAA